jgi:hypothetical protein
MSPIIVSAAAALAGALIIAIATVLAGGATVAIAADDTRTEGVQSAHGAISATVEGRIVGRETLDYLLGARAGQYANISMATDNGANYFNIIAPGESDIAFFNSSTASGGNQYEGTLPVTGNYKVRVYLMRSAARRGEVANYRLEMIIAEMGGAAIQPPTSAGEAPAAPEDGGPRHWEVSPTGGIATGPDDSALRVDRSRGRRLLVETNGIATRTLLLGTESPSSPPEALLRRFSPPLSAHAALSGFRGGSGPSGASRRRSVSGAAISSGTAQRPARSAQRPSAGAAVRTA